MNPKGDETVEREEVPARVLVEQLRRTRRLLDDLEWLAPRLSDQEDRRRLWIARETVLKALQRDFDLKRGVIL